MNTKERINENIGVIKEQIDKFDNKANILIAIVGIVFAVSLGMFEAFNRFSWNDNRVRLILLLTFSGCYFLSFIIELVFLVLVIFPRAKQGEDKKSTSYYLDVSKMKNEDILKALQDDNSDIEIDQLMINSKICTRKHKLLVKGIWTLIPLFAFAIAMFFTAIV